MHLNFYLKNNLCISEKSSTFAGQTCEMLKIYNVMRNFRVVLILLAIAFSSVTFAQETTKIEMFEVGVQLGGGFAWSNTEPVPGVAREYAFGWKPGEAIPSMETYGGVFRLNLHERWAVQLQGMAQRVMFNETMPKKYDADTPPTYYYYNTMCNLDAMAEFNILKYSFSTRQAITPYVALGLGVSIYNKDATFAFTSDGDGGSKFNTSYPTIGKNRAAALYLPVGIGVKMRLTGFMQIKASVQYDFYVSGTDKMVDLYGGTWANVKDVTVRKNNSKWTDNQLLGKLDFSGRPQYADLKSAYRDKNVIGNSHNMVFSVGVIFNITRMYKDMIIEY